jgi:hypothetical protein
MLCFKVDDSPLYDHAVKYENYFWSEGTLFTFVVNSPNFTDPASLTRFESFITKLESVQKAVGRESTQLWVRDFADYAKEWELQPGLSSSFTLPQTLGSKPDMSTVECGGG